MRKEAICAELIEYGNKLIESGFTKGTGGNLSVCDRESGHVYITPSGIEFDKTEIGDIVMMNMSGEIVSGHRQPSTEWLMHLVFYQRRTDINAIIHAHTTYSTVFACLNEDIVPSHYMLAVAGVSVRCAPYAPFGTPELAENAYEGMLDRKAVLLANHGILAGESSLKGCFNVIDEVEYCAKIHILARSIGRPVILDEEEMGRMLVRFKSYGKPIED